MTTNKEKILTKIKDVVEFAEKKFNISLQPIDVFFDLRGRRAGVAICRDGNLSMRFNKDMLNSNEFDFLLNNTVPHEVAHLVCFKKPLLGKNHDAGWKNVCRILGGDGQRCHGAAVIYAKGKTFEYMTNKNELVRCSETIHKRIQRGSTYRWKNKGTVTKECQFRVVSNILNFGDFYEKI